MGWLYLFLAGEVGLAKSNQVREQGIESHEKKVAQLTGMSAIGYLPLWRVELSAKGIELGMPHMETGLLPYTKIRHTPEGWHIYSHHKDIEFDLTIVKEPGKCSMSKQWYPYQSRIEVKVAGQLPQSYKGTAMEKGQKPLPPHPSGPNGLRLSGLNHDIVYKMMDRLKFALMSGDFQGITPLLHFPLRVNSSSGTSFMINNVLDWKKRCDQVMDAQLTSRIINAQYDDLYETDGMVGLKGGILVLKIVNGQPKIATINKK